MKIGFDGKRAVCNFTGIGNYSRLLIDLLSAAYPDNTYRIFTPKLRENPLLSPLLEKKNVTLELPAGKTILPKSLWRTFDISRQIKNVSLDIYHGLSNELPLTIAKTGTASVVTIHDLIWRKIPRNYSAIDRLLYDYKYRKSAINATRVIAISECTKRDLINDFKIPEDKIDVVYQGCNPIFRQMISEELKKEIRSKYNLPDEFILSVGTLEYRKNQMLAVKAMRGLPGDCKLVIAGGDHKGYSREIEEYIRKHRLGDRVKIIGKVDFTDLPALYSLATVTSYTSRYEGFGLPVIESISCKTPVIAATGSCLEEAGGPGALYVDPDDVDGYIEAAARLFADTGARAEMVAKGLEYTSRFNDENFVAGTMDTYIKSLSDKK